MKKRIKMIVAYDGTDFCGWQKQKEHALASELPSIQETLELGLAKIFNHPIELSASGRTDAGVHAVGQVCHFETDRKIPKDLCWAVRSGLPMSISPKIAWEAPENFHSTISATHKTYKYWIWNGSRSPALLNRYSWWIRQPLDAEKLNKIASLIVGRRDFESFRSKGTPVKHSIREISSARWWWRKPDLLEFEVTGNGFMKQMVRNLVGTQVDLLSRGQPPEKINEIILAQDRKAAGPAAPAQGLYLYRVYYPKSLDSQCRRL